MSNPTKFKIDGTQDPKRPVKSWVAVIAMVQRGFTGATAADMPR